MNRAELFRLLEDTAARLAEHFDSVQILATLTESGYTHSFKEGRGDWFARVGVVHEFLDQDQHRSLAHEIGNEVELARGGEDDDDDDWVYGDF